MAERTEDLNLPLSVVTRIIKNALPVGVNVSKEARVAMARAASVFVLYATATANNYALKSKRRTLAATDVIEAMKDMEFDTFIEPLKAALAAYRQQQPPKMSKRASKGQQQQQLEEEEFIEPPPKRSAYSAEFAEGGELSDEEQAPEEDNYLMGQYEGNDDVAEEGGYFNEEEGDDNGYEGDE